MEDIYHSRIITASTGRLKNDTIIEATGGISAVEIDNPYDGGFTIRR